MNDDEIDRLLEALGRYQRLHCGPGLSSPAAYAPTYCRVCEEPTLDVVTDDEQHTCPVCGRSKGILELGTTTKQQWDNIPDSEK